MRILFRRILCTPRLGCPSQVDLTGLVFFWVVLPAVSKVIFLLLSRGKSNREPIIPASACSSLMANLPSMVGSVLGDFCTLAGGVGPPYFK